MLTMFDQYSGIGRIVLIYYLEIPGRSISFLSLWVCLISYECSKSSAIPLYWLVHRISHTGLWSSPTYWVIFHTPIWSITIKTPYNDSSRYIIWSTNRTFEHCSYGLFHDLRPSPGHVYGIQLWYSPVMHRVDLLALSLSGNLHIILNDN